MNVSWAWSIESIFWMKSRNPKSASPLAIIKLPSRSNFPLTSKFKAVSTISWKNVSQKRPGGWLDSFIGQSDGAFTWSGNLPTHDNRTWNFWSIDFPLGGAVAEDDDSFDTDSDDVTSPDSDILIQFHFWKKYSVHRSSVNGFYQLSVCESNQTFLQCKFKYLLSSAIATLWFRIICRNWWT